MYTARQKMPSEIGPFVHQFLWLLSSSSKNAWLFLPEEQKLRPFLNSVVIQSTVFSVLFLSFHLWLVLVYFITFGHYIFWPFLYHCKDKAIGETRLKLLRKQNSFFFSLSKHICETHKLTFVYLTCAAPNCRLKNGK